METALDTLSDSKIEQVLPDYPIRSLYQISYVYGQLDVLQDIADAPDSVSDSYIKYLTPSASIDSEFGEPNSLVSIDLIYDSSQDTIKYSGVSTDTISKEKSLQVGYCRPDNKSSQTTVHSITKMTSGSGYDLETISEYLGKDMFSWITQELLESINSRYKHKDLLQKLSSYGSDNLSSTILTDLQSEVEGETSLTGLMTLSITIDGKKYYPGELDVFNEGMKYNKIQRLETADSSERSNGVCYLTGASGTVYSAPFGSPYNMYASGMKDSHWMLNTDNSPHSRPVSADAIMYLVRGSESISEFNTAITEDNDRIAYIPYYSRMDVEGARELYRIYQKVVDNPESEFISLVSEWLSTRSELCSSEYSRQLYGLLYKEVQSSVYKFRSEVKEISTIFFEQLNEHRITAVEATESGLLSTLFSYDSVEDDVFYSISHNIVQNVLSGDFIRDTMGEDMVDVYELTFQFLSGESLSEEMLYRQYSQKSINSQQSALGGSYGTTSIPTYVVQKQLLQWYLFEQVGSCPPKGLIGVIKNNTTMARTRSERFTEFVESHNDLQSSDEKLACFALGGLVGRISAVQSYDLELSTLLSGQYPVKSLSSGNLQTVVQNVLAKHQQYLSAGKIGPYNYYTDRLVDSCLTEDMNSWNLTTDEVRYYYSLGVSYGYSDTATNYEKQDDPEDQTSEEVPVVEDEEKTAEI